MIVVMERDATSDQVEHMVKRVDSMGLKSHVIVGTERTVIAAIGEKREDTRQSLESGPGVSAVVPILAPYKVASREVKAEPTVVQAGSFKAGAGHVGATTDFVYSDRGEAATRGRGDQRTRGA